jgi:Mg/Co/Ni transporter MgtE
MWNKGILKAYNGKLWESDKKASILMRYCISEDLFDILWNIQINKQNKIQEQLKSEQDKKVIDKLKQNLDIISVSLYGKK